MAPASARKNATRHKAKIETGDQNLVRCGGGNEGRARVQLSDICPADHPFPPGLICNPEIALRTEECAAMGAGRSAAKR